MVTTRRRLLGLFLSLPLLLAACAAPVTVERIDPRTVHRELTANVLTVGKESGASHNVLYRWDLTERFESDPEGALARLHAAVAGGGAGRDELFALAELSFLHAERTGKREYYLAAAVYAYALLFPNGAAEPLYPVDPRLRVAADLSAIDSGTRLWDTVSQRALDDLILRDETREQLRRTLFLQPLHFVRRIIFISTPHRGSYEAGSWIAQHIAGFASLPKGFVDVMKDLVTGNPDVVALSLGGLPRSINDMTPGNPFVQTLASIPVAPGIAVNSIVAVSGNQPLAEDDDGIVKYTSAHLDDVESELVIHSGHSAQGHPLAITEVRRILYRHGESACLAAGLCGAADSR